MTAGFVPFGAGARPLPQFLLLLLEAVQEVDDDVADAREVAIEALLAGFLTEGVFEDTTQQVGDGAQVGCVDFDCVESPTCYVELVTQTDVDIGDLALGGGAAGPLGEGLEQLFGGDEEVCDGLFDGGELLLGLEERQ